ISLSMPKTYKAKTTIMPIESSAQQSVIPSGLVPFAGIAGIDLGKSAPAKKFLIILESRTVAKNIIQKLDLMPFLYKGRWDSQKGEWKDKRPPCIEDAIDAIQGMVEVEKDKRDLVSLFVNSVDPEMAARIANAYIEELEHFINSNSLTIAKKKRIFLEEQLAKTGAELKIAEENFKNFQKNKKLVAVEQQTEAAIGGMVRLKTSIYDREMQLGVLKGYVTPENLKYEKLVAELRELKKQLAQLEERERKQGGMELSLTDAPELGLDYFRLKRDVSFQNELLKILGQQYEMAKLEEAKEDISFQVIDEAVPPVRKFKPKVRLNVMLAGIVSIFLGIFIAFFFEYLEKMKKPSS
ncbi:MAG: GNVR domain-containing protein, partial [Thermodesulfobacteriota bacterium]|nr:GNVR domain-containing protein [Thermodesulfobacteriota bacterium]